MAQWVPGGLAQAKLRVAQLLASPIHWWEAWEVLLVPSQAGPQCQLVGGIRTERASDRRAHVFGQCHMLIRTPWSRRFCEVLDHLEEVELKRHSLNSVHSLIPAERNFLTRR